MSDILPFNASNQETLEDKIIRHEGFRSMPYKDTLGNWTIGFGHCITKAECDNYPNGISWDDAEALLKADIVAVKQNCATEFPWVLGLDDIRQQIIWEMAFQLGIGGVAQFKDMIAAIRDQDWDSAAQEMLNSAWHKETPARCEELAGLMLSDICPQA